MLDDADGPEFAEDPAIDTDEFDGFADEFSDLAYGESDHDDPEPVYEEPAYGEPVYAHAGAPAEPVDAAAEPVAPPAAPGAEIDFDRERLVTVVDRLERDIALVESAMDDLERGDQISLDAALAALGDRPA